MVDGENLSTDEQSHYASKGGDVWRNKMPLTHESICEKVMAAPWECIMSIM